jgi:serine protease Do
MQMKWLAHSRLAAARIFLAAGLVLSGQIVGAQAREAKLRNSNVLDQLNNSLKDLADRISPAVVDVQAWGYGIDDDDNNNSNTRTVVKQHVSGSGVILDASGYIITNAHVINGARRVRVILNPHRPPGMPVRTYMEAQGRAFDATVVGTHQETDLAVLKIKATDLPTVPLFNYENLRQGQMVIALGSPLGMRNAATIGIVSSIARQIDSDSNVVYIQTDAALNPGNSGGALVDTAGNLVGINAAMMSGEKVGLAIPSDTVKFVYEQIRDSGRVRQGEIGLRFQTITSAIAAGLGLKRESGVIVSDARPGFPAEKAGVQPQDIIIAVDGKAVESAMEFANLCYRTKPGSHLRLRLLREGREIDVNVAVVERMSEPDTSTQVVDPEQNIIGTLGIMALTVDKEVADIVPGIREPSGVVVTGKMAKREGSEIALKIGDVIHAINGSPIRNIDETRTALSKVSPGAAVVLKIERQRRFLFLAFEAD